MAVFTPGANKHQAQRLPNAPQSQSSIPDRLVLSRFAPLYSCSLTTFNLLEKQQAELEQLQRPAFEATHNKRNSFK